MRYLFYILIIGCASPDEVFFNTTDSDSQIDSQVEDVTSDVDTGQHDPVCNKQTMDYDTEIYLYNDYPPGPYGFKETICWHADGGYLTSDGDTIHNICLPSVGGETICLNDLREKEILFVNIVNNNTMSLLTGTKIDSSSQNIKSECGIESTFVSIYMGTKENAIVWRDAVKINSLVLYDEGIWKERMTKDSWPSSYPRNPTFVFSVNTSDMKIWNTFIGWDFQYNAFSYNWYQSVCQTLLPVKENYSYL